MAITTAQYKAAVEAKIAAATGATSLDDLTLIKSNADLWLRNNSGGTITGYASLEALIQAKQDTLTGGSTLDDISLAGMAALPPATARTIVRKRQTFLLSGTWTRPANMVGDTVYITAAGAGGGGNSGAGGLYVRHGNGGEWCERRPVDVGVLTSVSVIIGAGGAVLNPGGNTTFGSLLTLRGGTGGFMVSAGVASWAFNSEKNTVGTHGTLAIPTGKGNASLNTWEGVATTSIAANLPPGRSENGSLGAGGGNVLTEWNAGYGPGYFADTGANSGAGGGPGQVGFSGRLDIEWDEYQ